MRLRSFAALAVFSLFGCVHAPPLVVSPPPPMEAPKPWYGDVQALAREVAAARGLELTARFEVVELDDAAFADAMAQQPTPDFARASNEVLAEFLGAASPPVEADDTLARVTQAFYDRFGKRIVVRHRVADGDALFVLAHELGHVLQDQQGLFARMPEFAGEPMAWRALIEGDATLSALLWQAKRSGRAPARVIERARFEPELSLELAAARAAAKSPREGLYLEWAQLPYSLGTRFFADLYATGGLELVNRVLRGPPMGLEAFFSTQRWLSEGTQRLAPLTTPPRRLGLFGLRGLLQSCLSRADPPPPPGFFERLEENYVDDAFRRSNGTLTWVTAWASHGPLGQAYTQLVLRCVGLDTDEKVANLARVGPAFEQRAGVVAVVLNAPSADGKRLAKSASRTPLESVGAPLGGELSARDRAKAFREVGPGKLDGETWRHDALGLSLRLPGMTSTRAEKLLLEARAPGVWLQVTFADEPSSRLDAEVQAVTSAGAWMISNEVDATEVQVPRSFTWAPMKFAGAEQATSELGASVVMRTARVPVLDGTASVVVWGVAMHAGARQQLESWLGSLQLTAP